MNVKRRGIATDEIPSIDVVDIAVAVVIDAIHDLCGIDPQFRSDIRMVQSNAGVAAGDSDPVESLPGEKTDRPAVGRTER